MYLVVFAAASFVTGVVLTPIKLREQIIDSRPRLLPSTFFACCAALGFAALMSGVGPHITFWGAIAGLSGGFLGSVASLFSIPILPGWQWLTQLLVSGLVFAAVVAHLLRLW
jgi:hypothetical protein